MPIPHELVTNKVYDQVTPQLQSLSQGKFLLPFPRYSLNSNLDNSAIEMKGQVAHWERDLSHIF
jgi:hypothetical protein